MKKTLAELRPEELKKNLKILKVIIGIETGLLILIASIIIYGKVSGEFKLNTVMYSVPVMLLAVVAGPIISSRAIKKELERRGENV